jgi:hypothetical protein
MEQLKGNPRPSGNIDYYMSIEEKEEKCKEMTGYNDSLVVGSYIAKTKKIGEQKKKNDGRWNVRVKKKNGSWWSSQKKG